MTCESPILALLLLPVVAIAFAFAGRWLNARARWLIRGAVLAAAAALPGFNIQCERPLLIAAMVDVSPSTRGATFRDERAVATRLTPLLAGRPYTMHYFADGPVTSATEAACARTRLAVPSDADAVVLLSDGRFDASTGLPPVYVVVDPALDAPADARVRAMRWTAIDARDAEAGAVSSQHKLFEERRRLLAIDVIGTNDRSLRLKTATPALIRPPRGPNLLTARTTGDTVEARFDVGDLWPENDRMTLTDAAGAARRLAAGVSVAGFENIAPAALPTNVAGYASAVSVAVSTSAELSAARAAALHDYVTELGGSLVLVGAPADASAMLRAIAPLSAVPPAGPQQWVVLLDASGSMAADDGRGRTRWAAAIEAAKATIDRLPDDARVTVMRFAGDVRTIASGSSAAARAALAVSSTTDGPGGRTGLRAALMAVAAATHEPTRLLLLTDGDADLGDVDALAASLRRARVTVDAVAPSAAVARLCAAAGGRCVVDATPVDWAKAFGGLTGGGTVDRAERLAGRGGLASQSFTSKRRWPAWAKAGADVLVLGSSAASGDAPAVAVWNVGLGCVLSVAAEVTADDLAAVATAAERSPVDGRFALVIDEAAGVARLTAVDAQGPINGLRPQVRRGELERAMGQVAPGAYELPLERLPTATVVAVAVRDAVVARRALPGRYPLEFDAIGNDRDALGRLVARSGGRLIEAGDQRPIAFTAKYVRRPAANDPDGGGGGADSGGGVGGATRRCVRGCLAEGGFDVAIRSPATNCPSLAGTAEKSVSSAIFECGLIAVRLPREADATSALVAICRDAVNYGIAGHEVGEFRTLRASENIMPDRRHSIVACLSSIALAAGGASAATNLAPAATPGRRSYRGTNRWLRSATTSIRATVAITKTAPTATGRSTARSGWNTGGRSRSVRTASTFTGGPIARASACRPRRGCRIGTARNSFRWAASPWRGIASTR